MKDKVINLGNDLQYYVLEEIKENDRTFAFAVRVDNNDGKIFEDTIIVEVKESNEGKYIDKIKEKELEQKMIDLFLQKSIEKS